MSLNVISAVEGIMLFLCCTRGFEMGCSSPNMFKHERNSIFLIDAELNSGLIHIAKRHFDNRKLASFNFYR